VAHKIISRSQEFGKFSTPICIGRTSRWQDWSGAPALRLIPDRRQDAELESFSADKKGRPLLAALELFRLKPANRFYGWFELVLLKM